MPETINSPLNIQTFGETNTKLDPGLKDAPGEDAYRLDTYNKMVEANVLGIFNRHVRIFTIKGDGHVVFTGDVTIPGTVVTAPLKSPHMTGSLWEWTHNLGYKPFTMVIVETDTGPLLAPVEHVNNNKISIQHTASYDGYIYAR